MDYRDKFIIKRLLEEPKVSKSTIARELNITETAVRKRLKKLENKKIILGYKPIINFKKAGLYYAITGINIEIEKLAEILRRLEKLNNIKLIHLSTGDHNIVVEIVTETLEEMEKTHKKIKKINGVKEVYPSLINLTIKP